MTSTSPISLVHLPPPLLAVISTFLPPAALVNLTVTDKSLRHTVIGNDAIWHELNHRVWCESTDATSSDTVTPQLSPASGTQLAATTPSTSQPAARSLYTPSTQPSTPTHDDKSQSPYHFFQARVTEYGSSAITAYAPVKHWWTAMEQWLKQHHPTAHHSLQPPASREAVDEVVQRYATYGYHVPIEWQLLYRIHNGQVPTDACPYSHHGMFGRLHFYDVQANLVLPSIDDELILSTKTTNSNVISAGAAVAGSRAAVQRICLAAHSEHLTAAEQQMYGHTSAMYLRFWLTSKGTVERDSGTTGQTTTVAPNLMAFLNDHYQRLATGVYSPTQDHGISRFAAPGKDPCGSVAVTGSIEVAVSVLYVPEFSSARRDLFTYHISIRHTGDSDQNAKLTTRHWQITDSNGHTSVVDGEGVIGFKPHMYRGCPEFSYESCSPLATPQGQMEGYFTFEDQKTHDEFRVEVAPFTFDVDRNFV